MPENFPDRKHSHQVTLIRLNRIDDFGNRRLLYESDSIEAMERWADENNNPLLEDMFRFMKKHQDGGRELVPCTTRARRYFGRRRLQKESMRNTRGFQTALILTVGLCLFAIRESPAQPRIDVKVVGVSAGDTITVKDSKK